MLISAIEPFLFLGWFAVVGGVLNAVGDWALLGAPIAGKEIKLEQLKDKPVGHVRFGVYIAMVAIPMWLGVLFPVVYVLRDAPAVYAIIACVGIVLFIMYSQTYHVSYVFYDIAYREGNDDIVAKSLIEKKRMQLFTAPVSIIMSLAMIVGGLIGGAPIWWIVLNPTVVLLSLAAVGRALPGPLGGFLFTGGGSLGFALFGLVTMLAV